MSLILNLFKPLFNSSDKKSVKMSRKNAKKCEKKSYVMDDDVLGLILGDLPIKQLLRLQRVSKQFKHCCDYALKRKTGIRLGKKFQNLRCLDQNHSVIGGNVRRSVKCRYNKYDLTYELDKSLDSFGVVLRKCPNIKSLYLSECRITPEVLQLIIDNCKRLECLTLAAIFVTTDRDEWKYLCSFIAQMNLKHLAIVGQCYEYEIRNNCSTIQEISPKINDLVIELPFLEKLMAYWYGDNLDSLFCALTPNIKALQLIRCSKLSIGSLSLLNSGNFPLLKDIKLDLNFYGRTHETEIFTYLCHNLNLDRLVFYCDSELDSYEDLTYSGISKLKIKIYEQGYTGNYRLNNQFLSVLSLCLVNYTWTPESSIEKSFPQLRDLTLTNYELRCICTDDWSDGESSMYFGYRKTDCRECNVITIKSFSRITNLRRFRIFSSIGHEAKGFQYFLHLPILEIPHCYHGYQVTPDVAQSCLKICKARRLNPFTGPLTLRSNKKFIKKLHEAICKMNCGVVPNNLRLNIREYCKRRYTDY